MLRELNERCSDGLVVRLLWNDVDGDVVLAVQDGPRVFADGKPDRRFLSAERNCGRLVLARPRAK